MFAHAGVLVVVSWIVGLTSTGLEIIGDIEDIGDIGDIEDIGGKKIFGFILKKNVFMWKENNYTNY